MRHKWAKEHLSWVRANLHLTKDEMAKGLHKEFGFTCTKGMVVGVFKNHGIVCGRTGRFEPGNVPFNTGKKGVNGRSTTTFKKGHRPHNWVPVGSERDNTGIIEIKIGEPHQWRSKHVLLWEGSNGPVPPGHVVIFADGDRRNFAAENLMLVSRAELAVMNKKRLVTDNADATKVGKTVAQLVIACGRRANRK